MKVAKILVFSILLFILPAQSEEQDEDALWEYGVGFGYVHFAQYPTSNQYTNVLLPFPTFQYRGKRLRADDRDGTRAFLYKIPNFSVEISGGGTVPVDSGRNDARLGMPNLPLVINLGPQIVYNFSPEFDFRLGIFQATKTDLQDTRFAGQVLEGKFVYKWESNYPFLDFAGDRKISGRVSLQARSGSKEFLDTYFTVQPEYANLGRSAYDARSGFIDCEFSYFQSFKLNRTAFYFGFSVSDYSQSINRLSPLHRSDVNLSYLTGITYELAESKKPAIDDKNTEGFIH